MPRGQKSKLRAREKRNKDRDENSGLQVAQATAAEEEESPSSSSPDFEGAVSSSPAAGTPQKPQRAPPTTTAAAAVSYTKSQKGAKKQGEENKNSSEASTSSESSRKESITKRVGMLVQLLVFKYKIKEPITKGEMLRLVNKRYREHFPEIFRRASELMELQFGLGLEKVNPSGNTYTFVIKLDFTEVESLRGEWGFPKNGLLMPLLGVIFLNGNRASEKEIWEFLNMLGIYDGKKHFIYGEPRKLITQDMVQEGYLEYQQVPNSNPPRFQFLWGPRAFAESSKMQVLEFLAKVNDTTPSSFPSHYEEALKEEEERARARDAAKSGITAKARACSKAKSTSCSHP
ncbi:melanoma-associated antigen B2-like [Carlito syrichta]|uniref:Melanoma-associated antigen B2-like n=1 Tax=Carlito syrichta TaxID=1868482 RepID=A0A1U7TIG6_CARSF|nr:melanoma-associated antigen B2-like [Carlito syrichta]